MHVLHYRVGQARLSGRATLTSSWSFRPEPLSEWWFLHWPLSPVAQGLFGEARLSCLLYSCPSRCPFSGSRVSELFLSTVGFFQNPPPRDERPQPNFSVHGGDQHLCFTLLMGCVQEVSISYYFGTKDLARIKFLLDSWCLPSVWASSAALLLAN